MARSKKYRVESSKSTDYAKAGNIGGPVNYDHPNAAPNRNLSPQQFRSAKSYEQQRLF